MTQSTPTWFAIFIAAALVSVCSGGCAPSLRNLETNPTNAREDLQMGPGSTAMADTYVANFNDPTFAANPTLLLGQVAIVQRASATDPCPTAWQNQFEWYQTPMRNVPMTPQAVPELRGSTTVTSEGAASVDALSFISAEIGANEVASVIITDVDVRRISDSDDGGGRQYEAARTAFWDANPTLRTNPRICTVMVVAGMLHTTVAYREYSEATASASGGYAGVQVNGHFYASNEQFRLTRVFGLSFRVIHRYVEGEATALSDAGGDPLTDDERAVLRQVSPERLSAVPAVAP